MDDDVQLSEDELARRAERLGRYESSPLLRDERTGLVYDECERCGFPHVMPSAGMIPPCPWCREP